MEDTMILLTNDAKVGLGPSTISVSVFCSCAWSCCWSCCRPFPFVTILDMTIVQRIRYESVEWVVAERKCIKT